MKIEKLRKLAGREEIDYSFLMSVLSEYARPREKVSAWLKTGDLIRIKKGLYIFGKEAAQLPYSLEVLANLIYGPSAISLSTALAFYGLIPERVMTVMSITNKRNKSYSTPVGEFTYRYLHPNKYPVGIELFQSSENHRFFIASPEKALCDQMHLTDKKIRLDNMDDMEDYLLHDLRIEKDALSSFRLNKLIEINKVYGDLKLELLVCLIRQWKNK